MMETDCRKVLAAYPEKCEPRSFQALGSFGGNSGALFWRVETVSGPMLLRRWPREYPKENELGFIQAVLWHASQEGFTGRLPLPEETLSHAGFVQHDGYLWQLEPWAHGEADYATSPSEDKLVAAMLSLAEFHQATAEFPIADGPISRSTGIVERRRMLEQWSGGQTLPLTARVAADTEHRQLAAASQRILQLFPLIAGNVAALLSRASRLAVPIQPCIADIHRDHVFFEDDHVSAIVDFGSMRIDNVATDIARLLGSLAGDDAVLWDKGLNAYQAIRPLSDNERYLIVAFDRSAVALSGLNWIHWIYGEGRRFDDYEAIRLRLQEILARLEFAVKTCESPSAFIVRSA